MIRILLLMLALVASPARAAVEMSFYSHELTSLGRNVVDFPHAFITLRGTPDVGGKPVDGNWGFTAAKVSPALLMGPVKGLIESAGKSYVRASRRHLTLRLSDARYAAVQSAFRRWAAVRGKSYDLDKRNCVHFVAEMARAAGLSAPDQSALMKTPAAFLDAVAARNKAAVASR